MKKLMIMMLMVFSITLSIQAQQDDIYYYQAKNASTVSNANCDFATTNEGYPMKSSWENALGYSTFNGYNDLDGFSRYWLMKYRVEINIHPVKINYIRYNSWSRYDGIWMNNYYSWIYPDIFIHHWFINRPPVLHIYKRYPRRRPVIYQNHHPSFRDPHMDIRNPRPHIRDDRYAGPKISRPVNRPVNRSGFNGNTLNRNPRENGIPSGGKRSMGGRR